MLNVDDLMGKMTLRQKIGQMFLQDFVGKEDIREDLKELNKEGELGGIIFFSGSNVENIEQLHTLTNKIQSYAKESPHGIPYFITLDQEGGQLTALFRGATIFPGNMAMGFANDKELSYDIGHHIGKELKYAGININFAPVLDVSYDSVNGVNIVDNRMFSSKPEVVASMGSRFVKGLEDAGIIACGKHFPGQRLAEKDTHHALDIIDYDKERLESVELLPFKRVCKEGIGAIMTHHAIYKAFDDVPATLSKKTIGYLREDLDFDGVVITDDLIMKAVIGQYGAEQATEMTINAGVDLIIFTGHAVKMIDHVEECVKSGKISEDRINESCLRILKAKSEYGVGEIPAEKGYKPEDGGKISLALSREALVKYHDPKNIFPIKVDESKKLGVVLANPARLVMSDTVNFYDISLKNLIEEKGYHPYVKEAIMPWNPTDEEILSLFDIGFISDVLIFTTVNGYRFDRQIEVLKQIKEMADNRPAERPLTIISVATRSPDDVKILEKYSDAVIATGGITPLLIEALVDAIFKTGEFTDNEAKKI